MKKFLKRLLVLEFWLRQRRLGRARKPMPRLEFVQTIRDRGGDPAAAELIWAFLIAWIDADGFTPYPDDRLDRIFGIVAEEFALDPIRWTV